jgi:nitrite reductase (NADH) small subunit
MTTGPDVAVNVVACSPEPEPGAGGWETVCSIGDLTPDRGVAALVHGVQVAVFRLTGGEVLAIDDLDPFSGASVLSRGLVGDLRGEPTVASPIYKQRFSLHTGRCIEDDSVVLRTWATRVANGNVEVAVA